ncbi:MAG: hypothetical protein DSY91_05585 [Deltaproteobacteria bacterium]|nr:MAG: hypothetical protein DSY91_05585 [Deltaproteobacteria bacterium]
MERALKLLKNRDFIFVLAIGLGLIAGQGARLTKEAVLPALAIIMTVSTLGIPTSLFKNPRNMAKPVITGILLTFLVQGGLLLMMGKWMISDKTLWTGIVLLASVPPAVAIIPFTGLLQGDTTFSLIATIGGYLSGLVLTPLICLAILGSSLIHPAKILLILTELVIAPIVLSRILVYKGIDMTILPYKGLITNWGFFIVIYTIIGLNRMIFFDEFAFVLPVIILAFISTFVLGAVIETLCHLFNLAPPLRVSLNLLGTQKNAGTAAGIGLVLFGKTAALPAAVYTILMIVYFIALGLRQQWRFRKQGR